MISRVCGGLCLVDADCPDGSTCVDSGTPCGRQCVEPCVFCVDGIGCTG